MQSSEIKVNSQKDCQSKAVGTPEPVMNLTKTVAPLKPTRAAILPPTSRHRRYLKDVWVQLKLSFLEM